MNNPKWKKKSTSHINNYTKSEQNFQFSRRCGINDIYSTAVQIRARNFSQLKTVDRAETFELVIGERGQLELKDEK